MTNQYILFLALVLTQFGRGQAATIVNCTVLSGGKLQMEIRSDIYTRLDAFDPSAATPTEMTSECVSRNETVNSTLYQVLTIVTDVLSRKQISPANLTTHNCFVKNSTIDSNGNAVDYRILALTQPPPGIVVGDVYLNVSCDPDTPSHEEFVSTAAFATQVSLNSTVVNATIVQIDLSLFNPTTQQPLTSPSPVGTEVKAKIDYIKTVTNNFVGVHVYNMEISGHSDFRQAVKLLDLNGCPAIEFNEQAKAGIEFGFEVDITNVNTTKIILNSGKFFIWAFVGAPLTFYVRVQYKFCSEVMDKCNNITAYCAAQAQPPAQGRKRRSTENIPEAGDLTTSVDIYFGPGTNSNQGGTSTNSGGKEEEEPICKEIYKFWIVSSVLGALLLLAMLFAIYLYFRLRREQLHVQKMADKFGISNPAVQT